MGKRIYCGNLSFRATEDDVRELFSQYGEVTDVHLVIDAVGVDRVIFGSDWPHIEALPEPDQYVSELTHLDDAARRRILVDNTAELNELRPA